MEVPAGPPIGPVSEPFPAFSTGVEARLFQMESAQAAQQEGLHARLVELEQFRLADFEDLRVRYSLQQRDISDLKVQVRMLTEGLAECRRKLEHLSERRNPLVGSDDEQEARAVSVRGARKEKEETRAVPVRGARYENEEKEGEVYGDEVEEELTAWAERVRVAREAHSQVAKPKSVKLRGRRQGERPYPTPKWKKKSSPDDSDSTDTSSSEDEGEVDDVSYRRRVYENGPCAKGVKAIIPSRDAFEDAVSYRTYRLENLDQTYNSRVARRLSGQVKRLAITFRKD